jgi:hypothetical protein
MDSPDLLAAKRLLDLAKDHGFRFSESCPARMVRCSPPGDPPED